MPSTKPASARHHYPRHAKALKGDLKRAIPTSTLRDLHVLSTWRHFLVLGRLLLLAGLAVTVIAQTQGWLPATMAMFVLGFVFFDFTILLHEVVHEAVFSKRNPRLNRILGHIYAFPSGMSASQFTRWHLDHHDELGDPEADPKRHHLSPKKNSRWLKAAYWTFLLIPIYFRAARQEVLTYPEDLRARIRRERTMVIGGHLLLFAFLWWIAGPRLALMAHLLPYLVVFPMAFALNRLGQHYDIDPGDPARWSTRMKPSWFWDWIFCWSNYHLEHHYFPRVPFYKLGRLNRELGQFYKERGIPERTYRQLLWGWFARNEEAHTRWSEPKRRGNSGAPIGR